MRDYNIDIVFCVDCSESMACYLDEIKFKLQNLYRDITEALKRRGASAASIRMRIIEFGDYLIDSEYAMLVTDFFALPYETERFQNCIQSVNAWGGGVGPQNGLEAIAYAMKSDWNTVGYRKRHIIVVITDKDAHDLDYGKACPKYPNGMVQNFNELTAWWGQRSAPGIMDENAKTILLFAPGSTDNTAYTKWTQISEEWNRVLHFDSQAGFGLSKVDYAEIITLCLFGD